MSTAATYSSTEKKRIRKSFAKRASVLNVPFLLATQLESYTAFLQTAVPPEKRKNEGLQAAFTSIFPISSHSGNARLEFVSFSLGEPRVPGMAGDREDRGERHLKALVLALLRRHRGLKKRRVGLELGRQEKRHV